MDEIYSFVYQLNLTLEIGALLRLKFLLENFTTLILSVDVPQFFLLKIHFNKLMTRKDHRENVMQVRH